MAQRPKLHAVTFSVVKIVLNDKQHSVINNLFSLKCKSSISSSRCSLQNKQCRAKIKLQAAKIKKKKYINKQ